MTNNILDFFPPTLLDTKDTAGTGTGSPVHCITNASAAPCSVQYTEVQKEAQSQTNSSRSVSATVTFFFYKNISNIKKYRWPIISNYQKGNNFWKIKSHMSFIKHKQKQARDMKDEF